MTDDDFEAKRRDQLTSAPGDKPDREGSDAEQSAAPRIETSETESGAVRIDIADTAAVRPGKSD
ncbi:hypothetical protein [Naasia lichenicola]|uniref:Multidrug transporter n=1 Tax=Naasia lichenicola TaxID=2565933 RepID=A0A4S4FTB2_9MICO|nr:hypothetical protein [Naasia lichenicola]THG32995.1 hypothetical protein E6C64_01100 [Naasia lichenicola]